MEAPVLSTITLLTEIVVSLCVYYVIWRGYTQGVFVRWLAFAVLSYEALFNITYMFSRLGSRVQPSEVIPHSSFMVGLAIFHGIFSIIMFVSLVAFFIYAARHYRYGENFFRVYRTLTGTFAIAWGISILSGIVFYFVLYS